MWTVGEVTVEDKNIAETDILAKLQRTLSVSDRSLAVDA